MDGIAKAARRETSLAGSGAFGVQQEDAFDFDNGLGVLMRAVAGGDDEFALGVGEVAAPVGDEAV